MFERALTHASFGGEQYERLEFLGDRVLGLAVAAWLYELFPDEPEGQLSKRLNALVAREICAEVGARARNRRTGAARQAGPRRRRVGQRQRHRRRRRGADRGALPRFRAGLLPIAFVRGAWGERVSTRDKAPQHPKSALQEWAAAQERKPPAYRLAERSGPQHAPTFVVEVEIRGVGSATAEGASKQEAETAAAAKLLEQLK